MPSKPIPSLVLLCLLALGISAQAAEAPDARRTSLEQKLKLVSSVLSGSKAKQAATSDNAEARTQIAKAQQLADAARESLAKGDLDQAGAALDQALKAVSAASSQSSKNLDVAAQRARHAELNEQVQTYRASLADLRKDPKHAAGAGTALEKLDNLTTEAGKLAAANKYTEANKLLADAYLHAANSLTTLRAGQTVTLSLKFDTPADEYAYEQKVNQSHEMLVEMMMAENKTAALTEAANRILDDNRRAKVEADKQAKAGKHPEAIRTLEGATTQLKRALQSFGMPIF
jgi:hypothetical protein